MRTKHSNILSQDYSPFGVTLSGRSWSGEEYRYGFQNQEKDDELWGGAISFKYRVEDARLGRFFSVDPLYKNYPWNSNYAFSENRLIDGAELDGLEFTVRIYPQDSDRPHIEVEKDDKVEFGFINITRFTMGAYHDDDLWCPGCGSTSNLKKIRPLPDVITISNLYARVQGTNGAEVLQTIFNNVMNSEQELANTSTHEQSFTNLRVDIADRFKTDSEPFLVSGVVPYEVKLLNIQPVIFSAEITHPDPLSEEALNMQKQIRDNYDVEAAINQSTEIGVTLIGYYDYDVKLGQPIETEISSVQSERTGEVVNAN